MIDAHREHRAPPTITPSTTSERAPMKQLSSMIDRAGLQRLEHAADAGAAGDVAVLADLRAGADRRPGVDHGAAVDIGAEIDEATASARRPARCRRSGARRSPARRGSRRREAASSQPANLDGTLSHQGAPPGPPAMTAMSLRRNESSTAFFSHWCTTQPPPFSRLRAVSPRSSSSSAASTASRTSPLVSKPIRSRSANAASMTSTRLSCCMKFALRTSAPVS